jgi:aspartate kinase
MASTKPMHSMLEGAQATAPVRPTVEHTVEKIGGTSMSRFDDLLGSVLIGPLQGDALYGRMFVVSAFGGVTDLLLENKRTGEPGVFARYESSGADGGEGEWDAALSDVAEHLWAINARILRDASQIAEADGFVRDRIEEVRTCLHDLRRLCASGHFQLDMHLQTVREMLASIGEAHSARVTVLRLRNEGVNARLVDLGGWGEPEPQPLEALLERHVASLDLTRELPIVTGYARCSEGLMVTYDRGYSEITFSRLAVVSGAREAVIHKEYHLCTADPRLVGEDRVYPIGRTNYDVADQLSALGMEAVHPGAAQCLRRAGIPLRVRHSFEPHHAGTLIDSAYRSTQPRVEIIAGRRGVFALEFFSHDMVDRAGHAFGIQKILDRYKLRTVTRESNANSITYYLATSQKIVKRIERELAAEFPAARVTVRRVAVVAAIGSNLDVAGLLSRCVSALADADINVLAVHQSMRAVDIRFVVAEADLAAATCALHEGAVVRAAARARVA